MQRLPIYDVIPEVKEKLTANPILILQAPPGAGKSTVLPIELRNESFLGKKKILMLEPRRLAARSVAARMAELLDEEIGETVGYRIRFETKVTSKTRIEVVTEGILTRMLQNDNALEAYSLVVFDEFHERSLHADLALALATQAQKILRQDLKILVMSATLEGDALSSLLYNAPIIRSEGRQFPVKIVYRSPERNSVPAVEMARAVQNALRENEGDILCFLPGTGDIHKTVELLEEQVKGCMLCPLYGDLPFRKQKEAILPDPSGIRKVVLATSIAETSLTIEGVRIVIDSGYSRVPKFDPRTGLTRLETVPVTRDSADQRAGRAGRLAPGICYRLWSEGTQLHLIAHRTPEILEADLAPLLLELMQWGVKDIKELLWLTPPPPAAVSQAMELLTLLGAVENNKITPRGKELLRLPTHPRIAHMLLEGKEENQTELAADIAALLEERDPMPKDSGADINLRIEALMKFRKKERIQADRNSLERIERLSQVWRKLLHAQMSSETHADHHTGKLLANAYPERIARQFGKNDSRYRLSNGRIVRLRDFDPLVREEWLSVAHLDAGTKEGKIFLAAALDHEDLLHLATTREIVRWDEQKGILVAATEKQFGSITISSEPIKIIPQDLKVKVLCDVIRKEGLTLFSPTEKITLWQARVLSLRKWRPEEGWPDVSENSLLEEVESWLSPYLQDVRRREDFKKIDLEKVLSGMLPWQLSQKLDKLAPEKIEVPSGSMIALKYFSDGSAPELAVRLQEVFGLLDTPTVNEGRNKVIMHLLSPGYKPVQITQDLRSFWTNTYAEVRKELRVRYQKHSWPEDPFTAKAVRGILRRK